MHIKNLIILISTISYLSIICDASCPSGLKQYDSPSCDNVRNFCNPDQEDMSVYCVPNGFSNSIEETGDSLCYSRKHLKLIECKQTSTASCYHEELRKVCMNDQFKEENLRYWRVTRANSQIKKFRSIGWKIGKASRTKDNCFSITEVSDNTNENSIKILNIPNYRGHIGLCKDGLTKRQCCVFSNNLYSLQFTREPSVIGSDPDKMLGIYTIGEKVPAKVGEYYYYRGDEYAECKVRQFMCTFQKKVKTNTLECYDKIKEYGSDDKQFTMIGSIIYFATTDFSFITPPDDIRNLDHLLKWIHTLINLADNRRGETVERNKFIEEVKKSKMMDIGNYQWSCDKFKFWFQFLENELRVSDRAWNLGANVNSGVNKLLNIGFSSLDTLGPIGSAAAKTGKFVSNVLRYMIGKGIDSVLQKNVIKRSFLSLLHERMGDNTCEVQSNRILSFLNSIVNSYGDIIRLLTICKVDQEKDTDILTDMLELFYVTNGIAPMELPKFNSSDSDMLDLFSDLPDLVNTWNKHEENSMKYEIDKRKLQDEYYEITHDGLRRAGRLMKEEEANNMINEVALRRGEKVKERADRLADLTPKSADQIKLEKLKSEMAAREVRKEIQDLEELLKV